MPHKNQVAKNAIGANRIPAALCGKYFFSNLFTSAKIAYTILLSIGHQIFHPREIDCMAAKSTAISKAFTKAQLVTELSEATGVTKKDVGAILETLNSVVERHLRARGAGEFTMPGLLKIRKVAKKKTKARIGRNPRTGESITIAAKPASTTVRIRALKPLKEMV
jgi:nucleoid DNA-binding protein